MKRVVLFAMLIFNMTFMLLQPLDSLAAGPSDSTEVTIESKLTLGYLCSSDSVVLTATVSIKKGDAGLALKNAVVEFSGSNGVVNTPLGKVKTNQEGIAVFKSPLAGLSGDKDGMITYTAKFDGNNKYPEAEASFMAKPAHMRLFFNIEDSLRILKVVAVQKNIKGEEIPVPSETVTIYIPRLFSLLKIGEITLDETGTGTMEFPKEIVGDTVGNLLVLARIEEHDIFGNIQDMSVINWGVHKQYYKAEVPSRELWTPIAPMWMIITLIIMLVGVWAHYIYAVYELVMIKRLSKKNKPLY